MSTCVINGVLENGERCFRWDPFSRLRATARLRLDSNFKAPDLERDHPQVNAEEINMKT